MADRFNPDSFGTFLESMQRGKAKAQPKGNAASKILSLLLSAPTKRLSSAELLRQSNAGVTEFAGTLSELQASGYVSLAMVAGEEVVELMPAGEQAARLAVPL